MNEAQTPILDSFARGLRRETHNLSRRPGLLWQQLYNRLQWGQESVRELLTVERARRSSGGARWLRTRTPFRESESLIAVLEGHTGSVGACAFSPDGLRICSASEDETLRLWDVASGGMQRVFETAHVRHACAFSPDGRRICSGSEDQMLRLWETDTGRQLRIFEGHGHLVVACAFSPDGRRICSGSYDHTVRLWDADTGAGLAVLEGHTDGVLDCAFSPDGMRISSAGMDGTLRLWDAETGQELWTGKSAVEFVNQCAFSPDGRRICSVDTEGALRLWDAASGEVLQTLEGLTPRWTIESRKAALCCAFSPDGRRICTATDRTLRLWDAASGEELQALEGHSGWINDCAFSPDGAVVVSASQDGTLRFWQVRPEPELARLEGHDEWVGTCSFSPDGRRICSGSADATLRLRDLEDGNERWCREVFPPVGAGALVGHTGSVNGCAFRPDGLRICSGSSRGEHPLQLRDAESGDKIWGVEPRWTVHDHVRSGQSAGALSDCAFSPDGRRICGAAGDWTVRVWDAATGEELRTMRGHEGMVVACQFSPDGMQICSASRDQSIRFWDAESKLPLRILRADEPLEACALSPDGRRICSAGWNGGLRLWDVETGATLCDLVGHVGRVGACAFSPDGSLVASAGDDRTFRLWESESGTNLASLPLIGRGASVGLHPFRPIAACGDASGALYLVDFIPIEYGAIIVTAVEVDGQRTVRCPKCWQSHPLDETWLGREIGCPTPACDLRLRVNDVVATPLRDSPVEALEKRMSQVAQGYTRPT